MTALPRKVAQFWGFALCLMALPLSAWGTPEMVFFPNPLRFDNVAVGDSARATLVIKNAGSSAMVVNKGGPVLGAASVFEVAIGAFELAAGDSVAFDVVFRPNRGGEAVDALVFESNANPEDPARPRPILQLIGVAQGAEIAVLPTTLAFSSSGIGVSVSQDLVVRNAGNDTLRVSLVATNLAQFVVDVSAFALGANESQTVSVTYTPDHSLSRRDTLLIVSNDLDEDTVRVVLDAQETPLRVGTARLELLRQDTLAFPGVGDTLSVLLFLRPNGASVGGVDAFLGYDPHFYRPANSSAPFIRAGLTLSRLQVHINAVVSEDGNRGVVHLSALTGRRDSVVTDNVIAQIDMVVIAPLRETTRLRMLVEAPLYNSQYITPSGLALTSPSETQLVLGNSPPVLAPFPILKMEEDQPANLGLASLATDAESSVNELEWSFSDPDGLMQVSVSIPDSAIGPVARFFPPENASGTYSIAARVTDPAGVSDSSVVVVDVAPVNDPPRTPGVASPADSTTGVTTPVTLQWQGGDPDLGDDLTYDVRFGQNRLFLSTIAQDLTDASFVQASNLSADETYFWQVVAKDASGAEVTGPVWQFRTQPDAEPPAFVAGPELLEVTDSTAAVFWSLDEPASARLIFGLEPDLSDSLNFQPILTPRLQLRNESIANLISGTPHYMQVTLTDASGNQSKSEIFSFTTTGDPPRNDPGDLNGDRQVDFSDFLLFANAYDTLVDSPDFVIGADFDADGKIDFADFLVFASVYGSNYALGKPAGRMP